MLILLLFLLFLSLFVIAWSLVAWQQQVVGEAREREEIEDLDSRLLRGLYPYLHYFGGKLEKLAPGALEDTRDRFRRQLVAAGWADVLGPEELFCLSVVASFLGGLYGLAMAWMLNTLFVTMPVTLMLLGFMLPFLYLKDKVKRRQMKIAKELPFVLDLLTLAVEAGLDFQAALRRIVQKQGQTPLARELRQLLQEIRVGKSRIEALKAMAERVQLDDLNSVVAAVVQAEELGSSLGGTLRVLGDQLRLKRFQRAEKLAMEAPIKILFPLLFFIMPQVFVVIFAPLILKIIQEGFF